MFKKYDYRLVRNYISYSIPDLCRLFKEFRLHEQTIREWVRSGELPSNKDGNKILIYGADFKQFLINRKKGRKRMLNITEFLCCKCKARSEPLDNTIISLVENRNCSISAIGMCSNCAFLMKRIYKRKDFLEIKDLFNFEPEALILLSDISCNPYKTHITNDQKLTDLESSHIYLSHKTNSPQTLTHVINGDIDAKDRY